MKKKPVIPGEDSEENEFSVDEPEEVAAGTDEEWEPGSGEPAGRRTSRRLRNTTPSKKPRLAEPSTSEEEEEEEEDEDEESDDSSDNKRKKSKGGRGRGRGRPATKKKNGATPVKSKGASAADNTVTSSTESTQLPTPTEKEFTSGAFVVLKSDFANAGDPPIWKIDGKALLQKYIPFLQDGKTLYKNTSTYSGWSAANKDLYYPAPIAFKLQNRKETIVEFLRESVNKDASVETGNANEKPTATAPNPGDEEDEEEEEEEEEEGVEGEEEEDPAATEQ